MHVCDLLCMCVTCCEVLMCRYERAASFTKEALVSCTSDGLAGCREAPRQGEWGALTSQNNRCWYRAAAAAASDVAM